MVASILYLIFKTLRYMYEYRVFHTVYDLILYYAYVLIFYVRFEILKEIHNDYKKLFLTTLF